MTLFLSSLDHASTLGAPLCAVVTALCIFASLTLVKRFGAGLLAPLARRTDTRLDDYIEAVVGGTHPLAMLAVASWTSTALWLPEARVSQWASQAATLALFAQVGAWTGLLAQKVANDRRKAAMAAGHPADATAWSALSFLVRLASWGVLGIVALDNLGVDVTALVAGLGIGGLALGLAVQNVLGDLFASLAIVLDRPFSIGDFLEVGDVVGTVEHVGLKTTRLRGLSGEQVVVSNGDLLASRIRNFQRMEERRVALRFGLTYDTPPDRLAEVPSLVRETVEAREGTRLDRAHLFRLGESSIDFEVVYYLSSPDYTDYMDVQQAVLLSLIRRFAELDIRFAYPTRTVYVHDARPDAILADELARVGAEDPSHRSRLP